MNMNNNQLSGLAIEVAERKSQTNWSEQPLSDSAWNLLIEAARRAPSSWNHQPARYILLKDPKEIKKLNAVFHRTNSWARKAAGLIVQIANPLDDDQIEGKDYYLYDCGLAMMSLVYQAQVLGLTSRQMIGWDETELKRTLKIPENYRIVVITAVGYPSHSNFTQDMADLKRSLTNQDKRFKPEHIAFWNEWKGVKYNEGN